MIGKFINGFKFLLFGESLFLFIIFEDFTDVVVVYVWVYIL